MTLIIMRFAEIVVAPGRGPTAPKESYMPMIDVTATEGTFADPHALAQAVAEAVMRLEHVPDIPMFRRNTAGFVHEIPAGTLADVDGSDAHVRVQVLTNAGALDRDKQIAVVAEL